MLNWMRSRDSKQNLNQVVTSSPLLPERGRSSSPSRSIRTQSIAPPAPNWKIRCIILVLGFGLLSILYTVIELSVGDAIPTPEKLMTKEKITVVINTFQRPQRMKEAVQFYSSCPYVGEVYVVWCEKTPPSPALVSNYKARKMPTVGFIVHEKDSLNNRFKPLDGVPHREAIFSVDDDIRVPCHELGLGFETWRSSPNSMVGYIPRIHVRGSSGSLDYRCWWNVWWYGAYSIVLTKAAFVHHKFFDLYTNHMPAQIRTYVDDNRNCEDIAMQFLMSNVTQLPPIYIKGHLSDEGAFGGISTSQNFVKAQHMDARANCLNDLVRMFGRNPLVKSHVIVDSAANGWTNGPSTWFEYISSDLWHFK